jgi:hypothetical protein
MMVVIGKMIGIMGCCCCCSSGVCQGKAAVAKEVDAAIAKLKDEAKENGHMYASVIKKALDKVI